MPFRRTEDNQLSITASLLLVLTYFGAVFVKAFEDFRDGAALLGDPELSSRVLGFNSADGIVALLLIVVSSSSIERTSQPAL